jgi:DNA-binding transcriptional LysR family regulator
VFPAQNILMARNSSGHGLPARMQMDVFYMNGSLDIDVLRAVLAVAETGGFTAAAKKLYRTQAAISGQIKRLEGQLGTRVFTRNSRVVQLTSDGEKFIGFARSMVCLNERALLHFSKKGPQERIRVGVPEGYAVKFLSPAVAQFLAEGFVANIEVECNHSPALLERLDTGKLDLVIATEQSGRRDGEILAQIPLAWIGNGKFEHKDDRELPLALYPAGLCAHRTIAVQMLDRHRIPWRIAMTSSHLESLLAPVRAGLALTVLPLDPLPNEVFEHPLHPRLPLLPSTGVTLHASRWLSRSGAKLRAMVLAIPHEPEALSKTSSAWLTKKSPPGECHGVACESGSVADRQAVLTSF